MTNFILINSETRAPVPLPFHTKTIAGVSVTIHDFNERRVLSTYDGLRLWIRPELCSLELIAESDFMAERG